MASPYAQISATKALNSGLHIYNRRAFRAHVCPLPCTYRKFRTIYDRLNALAVGSFLDPTSLDFRCYKTECHRNESILFCISFVTARFRYVIDPAHADRNCRDPNSLDFRCQQTERCHNGAMPSSTSFASARFRCIIDLMQS